MTALQPLTHGSLPAMAAAIATVVISASSTATADVWVFEPSAAIDQRVDSNYRLDPYEDQGVAATRAVAALDAKRETGTFFVRGQARVDALLSINENDTNERSSNQVLYVDTGVEQPRLNYGIEFSFKQDTPSRDISADVTDLSQTAADTGASVTQDQNIDRRRLVLSPRLSYNLSRRTELSTRFTHTRVEHGLPSVQDAIDRQVQAIINNENAPEELVDTLQNLGRPATINDIGRFTIDDELDDFQENLIEFSVRHQLTRIDTLSAQVSYSDYEAQSEFASEEPDRIQDPREINILRNPRLATFVDTKRFAIGYERSFSPTLTAGLQLGYFVADSDRFGELEKNEGYTTSISMTRFAGISQFSGRIGVEVFPSDIGDVVESLDVIGDYRREMSPLLDFSLRVRAYEPDAISDNSDDDRFARRFLSVEPKWIWRFRRAWTAGASYRYRRQKSQVDPVSGDSHALLFSLKYTPPSEIADLERNK